ncbi:phosphoenolpyruvate mutase [Polynucleobacter paneuropaeus]|nr:phosphoenolpyruvate mutase [Polynucleobacter paneuropaeus]
MPKVYISLTVDYLHHGHLNLISEARQLGDIVVGLLTDSAIISYKRLPYLTWEQRKKIIENIVGVTSVVPQNEWDDSINVSSLKPDYVVHGDDWVNGSDCYIRQRVLDVLGSYGGRLIEFPYTQGVSSGAISADALSIGSTPDLRRKTLRRLLEAKKLCRFLEAHSPISALIAESCSITTPEEVRGFDGFWSSSLTDSTEKGKPDIEALDISNRLNNINDIFEVTTKPLIIDADTGGKSEHFEIHARSMERLGISAVIIEDKTGLKKNSLFGTDVEQSQENIDVFCDKIRAGRDALRSDDFMIIARIESLILDKGMDDAILRARAYVNAGAHGIMIHSRRKSPDEIFEFARLFRIEFPSIPLVCVPTSYNHVTEKELEQRGFNIVIYANQMLRASYPAMRRVALSILENGRSLEVDDALISINEILELIPGTK